MLEAIEIKNKQTTQSMILYNVTVKIAQPYHDDWLEWMKTVHIPDMMKTGMFVENQMCRIIEEDPEGTSYAIQYKCQDMATFQDYQEFYAKQMQEDHATKFKNKYVAFRTLMEIVE